MKWNRCTSSRFCCQCLFDHSLIVHNPQHKSLRCSSSASLLSVKDPTRFPRNSYSLLTTALDVQLKARPQVIIRDHKFLAEGSWISVMDQGADLGGKQPISKKTSGRGLDVMGRTDTRWTTWITEWLPRDGTNLEEDH